MMGTPILRGRDFNSRDTFSGPRVALVNETLARRFPGGDPLGRRLRLVGPRGVDLEVVGVVRDGKYRKLTEEPQPFLYLPWGQRHEEQITFLIQTAGNPRALAGPVRRELQALDKDLPVYDLMTMEEHMRIPLLEPRLTSGLVGGLGLLGLLLAMIGLYGVVSYFVNRRSREFGIRMALGAGRGDVFRLVLRQGLSLVLAGTGIGLAAAFPLARLIASELHGVGPSDPVTFTAVPLLLAAVGALACYLPARRATKVDPITALRYE
jgi:predicted permease